MVNISIKRYSASSVKQKVDLLTVNQVYLEESWALLSGETTTLLKLTLCGGEAFVVVLLPVSFVVILSVTSF